MPQTAVSALQNRSQQVQQSIMGDPQAMNISGYSSGGLASANQTQPKEGWFTFKKFFGIDLQNIGFVLGGLLIVWMGILILSAPIATKAVGTGLRAGAFAAKVAAVV